MNAEPLYHEGDILVIDGVEREVTNVDGFVYTLDNATKVHEQLIKTRVENHCVYCGDPFKIAFHEDCEYGNVCSLICYENYYDKEGLPNE